jgi:hypothetical protein
MIQRVELSPTSTTTVSSVELKVMLVFAVLFPVTEVPVER